MTEDEAHAWIADRNVPRGTLDRLAAYAQLVRDEGAHQNLISASTMDHIWARHIVDSAQLLDHVGEGDWLDLGSGPGFPGLVVALVGQRPVTLVESRAKRVQFLKQAAELIGVEYHVEIFGGRAEKLPQRTFGVITARAFAPLPRLLDIAHRFSTPTTSWVLPKGRSAERELEEVAGSWQGDFRIVPSVTDSEAAIIVANQIRPGKRR